MLLATVAGGDSPQTSSTSCSVETTSLACNNRTASSARCLTPPSTTERSCSATSSGPRRRKSIRCRSGPPRPYQPPSRASNRRPGQPRAPASTAHNRARYRRGARCPATDRTGRSRPPGVTMSHHRLTRSAAIGLALAALTAPPWSWRSSPGAGAPSQRPRPGSQQADPAVAPSRLRGPGRQATRADLRGAGQAGGRRRRRPVGQFL